MSDDIDKTLEERQLTHGEFTSHAEITQKLKSIVHDRANWHSLSEPHKEAIDMILHKVGRIMNGNPNYRDHWDDIAGYAMLASERCTSVFTHGGAGGTAGSTNSVFSADIRVPGDTPYGPVVTGTVKEEE